MVDLFIDLVAFFLFFNSYMYFFPFSLFVSVSVYASLCDFVSIALLLPFFLGLCISMFILFFVFSIGFSACYHW